MATEKEIKERTKFNIKLGKHIKEKRLEKKLSAADLAKLCFMDKPNLLRIERGSVNTSIYILNRIAEGLEITLEQLFKGFK